MAKTRKKSPAKKSPVKKSLVGDRTVPVKEEAKAEQHPFIKEVQDKIEAMDKPIGDPKSQPNEDPTGTDLKDFLKPGDLARGQSEDELTPQQESVLDARRMDQWKREAEQKNQDEAEAAKANSVEPPESTGDSTTDKQSDIVQLLTQMNGFLEAMSINIAAMAAKSETAGGNSVELGSE